MSLPDIITGMQLGFERIIQTTSHQTFTVTTTTTSFTPTDSTHSIRTSKYISTLVAQKDAWGVRSDNVTVSSPSGQTAASGSLVQASNSDYSFSVQTARQRPPRISGYDPAVGSKPPDRDFTDRLLAVGMLTPIEFLGENLLEKIQSQDEFSVKSVKSVADPAGLVRLDVHFLNAPTERAPRDAWIIVDPAKSWRICEYESFSKVGHRRFVNEYRSAVDGTFAIARHVAENFDTDDKLQSKTIMEYSIPQTSVAVAQDFTLESFGLAKPRELKRAGQANYTIRIFALIFFATVSLVAAALVWRRSSQEKPKQA